MTRIYITRWALTDGIIIGWLEGRFMRWKDRHGQQARICGGKEGLDFFETESRALEKADQMRLARIASLERQIAKLKKMVLEVVP